LPSLWVHGRVRVRRVQPLLCSQHHVCYGLIEEDGVSLYWEVFLRQHLSDLFDGGALLIIIHRDLAVVEIGLGLEHPVDSLQD